MVSENLKSINFLVKSVFSQKSHWLLSGLFWLLIIFPVQAIELRVAIKKDVSNVKVGSSTEAIVKDGTGRQIGELTPMSSLAAKTEGNNITIANRLGATELIIEPTENGYVWIGDRWYRGKTHLVREGNTISAINYVDLEDYLYSVVGAEAVSTWPIEALKAQAVAARSYALYKRNTEANSIYDMDTTVTTQVYKGLDTEYTTTHEAVNSTLGQIMTYNNEVILAAFHSSSGGHTENVEDVWSSPLPYLRAVVDYDQKAPVFQWQQIFPVSRIKTLVAGVGNIRGLQPIKMTPRGRVIEMKVTGDLGSANLSGKEIRQALDLRSTLFRMSTDGKNIRVSGRGFGHGLGLSQWGAYYLAQQGVDYHRILAHYYQNANLTKLE
ncbi:SpoIID/LytB domain-containing protein [Waterburya agarophytonicola K14]|uniref:SpoIID/LytB domain-containing protein n=1 Tax=Waterburya agarophytonicola KI4 TaxID=2874699 RepID=A0A964BP05_9CYAN|nr:SpoIID/LytB domain-containing protein [Waterburya agarophytonicola]MCC0176166.1 SpoIID/LytB domain-containing protein [Waterburya agarophytonicola KI4]